MRLFGKRPERFLDDADFGRISERKAGHWEGQDFKLWRYSKVQVLIDAGSDGPSAEQRSFVQSLRADVHAVRDRIEHAILERAHATISQVGQLQLSSIYIPKAPPDQMWRVWYDIAGEEHYWFGAEITGWNTATAFVED